MKRATMAELFAKHGTDKDNPHQYGPAYDELIPDRERIKAVLEIGVWRGYSLNAWREAFPEAVIVGMDSDNAHCPQVAGCEVHRADQRLRSDLDRVVAGRKFDLIVDDASHIAVDQLFSLFTLWPHLAPGGIYVVEEWDMLPSFAGTGARPWTDSFPLLQGCDVLDTVDRAGRSEPLVVVRKTLNQARKAAAEPPLEAQAQPDRGRAARRKT